METIGSKAGWKSRMNKRPSQTAIDNRLLRLRTAEYRMINLVPFSYLRILSFTWTSMEISGIVRMTGV
jgi:hypothetical protein